MDPSDGNRRHSVGVIVGSTCKTYKAARWSTGSAAGGVAGRRLGQTLPTVPAGNPHFEGHSTLGTRLAFPVGQRGVSRGLTRKNASRQIAARPASRPGDAAPFQRKLRAVTSAAARPGTASEEVVQRSRPGQSPGPVARRCSALQRNRVREPVAGPRSGPHGTCPDQGEFTARRVARRAHRAGCGPQRGQQGLGTARQKRTRPMVPAVASHRGVD